MCIEGATGSGKSLLAATLKAKGGEATQYIDPLEDSHYCSLNLLVQSIRDLDRKAISDGAHIRLSRANHEVVKG